MRKVSLIVLVLIGNLSLISCTGESIAEVMNSEDVYANGEKEQVEPPEQHPEEKP